jgi:SNF2-related domain
MLVNWFRVILDEAHSCKSRISKTAKAVYALSARRRWAVTGMNDLLHFSSFSMTTGRNTDCEQAGRFVFAVVSHCNYDFRISA